MTDFDVEIVIDKDVLEHLFENDKYNTFLKVWLVNNERKAFVFNLTWSNFISYWKGQLKDMNEVRQGFIAKVRGVVCEYKNDGTDVQTGRDEVTETIGIVNRNYATCKFLIVDNKINYQGKGIKIGDENILTVKEFFSMMETENNEYVRKFLHDFLSD